VIVDFRRASWFWEACQCHRATQKKDTVKSAVVDFDPHSLQHRDARTTWCTLPSTQEAQYESTQLRRHTSTLPSAQGGAGRNEHTPFNTGRRGTKWAHSLQHREARNELSTLPSAQGGAERNEHTPFNTGRRGTTWAHSLQHREAPLSHYIYIYIYIFIYLNISIYKGPYSSLG